MAIWLFRAGKSGQWEQKFLQDGRIYLTWDYLKTDLSKYQHKSDLLDYLSKLYEDEKPNTVKNWLSQIWPIAHRVGVGDWVILPSKFKSAIHVGEVTGEYIYDSNANNPFYHYREVNWFAQDIPRSNFDQDILYSLGAFLTVCKIHRNNAEERIKAMAENNWKATSSDIFEIPIDNEDVNDSTATDLEIVANDQITKYIIRKFKGHRMAEVITSILKAKGFIVYQSPEGTDKGVDILASPEPMGFGRPRICVQVKSGDVPIDRPTLDQLLGTMQNFGADQGLLVSWSGFKSSVDKERAAQFFRVRLWDAKDIVEEIIANYERLDEDLKAELPFKKIWTLSVSDEE